jgi:hypothetical protein
LPSATENKIQLENNLNKVGYGKLRQLLTKQKHFAKPAIEGRRCCCNRSFCTASCIKQNKKINLLSINAWILGDRTTLFYY